MKLQDLVVSFFSLVFSNELSVRCVIEHIFN
jgi:hypothetical protein